MELLKSKPFVVIDVYRLPFGFRKISIDNDQIFINQKAFYCRGFGMHEDFEVFESVEIWR